VQNITQNMTPKQSLVLCEQEQKTALLQLIDRQIQSTALGESSSAILKDPKISQIVSLGLMVYTAEGLREFLNTPLQVFDKRTAIDLICVGEHDPVIGALAADFEGLGY
jgi:hypothetical protein